MTLEELSDNDGRDGANAYVLVEGIVYDVTDSPRWEGGNHNGNQAGQDLTDEILGDSPHGRSVLDRFEAIGRIEE
ncbi:cytochrome B5 [Isachenkonia alkalipeptolytica]|uniref:Cytochrome B5 n=2 Tax=Isachenkonia alkalipeptolytica TaxID=2565777 RepID=A0AA43XK14_9CLOT|nr:cytochrome B5 [Isachenkonia alkalipeptolytica]